jgi:hypothetical protein
MSNTPESEFDLEKLFLPAWATDAPSVNKYANFSGGEGPRRREDGPRDRGPRRDGPGGRPQRGGPRGDQRGGDRRPPPAERREAPPERREPLPLPEIAVSIMAEEKGVESLARQIRMTGRAYPLFDIAQLILQKPERHVVRFEVIKNPEGKPAQALFQCALDDSLWLSEAEAMEHILARHFGTFYQAEKTPTDPPKGTYTFVAQCGMSGLILGPPNYHDYQTRLHKLHAERFSRMPFEAFKARVKIVKDEAVVKKWTEDQSFKTEYNCLNVPEAKKLGSREEVEQHFRETHAANVIKPVDFYTLPGAVARNLRSAGLQRAARNAWEEQRRFPLRVATSLSQQFAGHGLQFFKVNKTVTHVSVARPHYLDWEATPVSEGIRRIVEFINTNPKTTRRKLIDKLAPAAPVAAIAPPVSSASPATPAGEAAPAVAAPAPNESPEQTAVASDLHWLIHQGHVIEFANGVLETAKKPAPRPPRPEPKKQTPPAESPAATGITAETTGVEAPPAAEAAAAPTAAGGPSAPVAPAPAEPPMTEPAGIPAGEPPV